MSALALRVDGLSKSFELGTLGLPMNHYPTIRDEISDFLGRRKNWFKKGPVSGVLASKKQNGSQILWALKDLNVDIHAGEIVGIIGKNGAGKSTLLKIISRITQPTSGRVMLYGRVASLLEVGTGFHPELTGRENIFLNGAILGMKKQEIKRQFDEIVDFAQVDAFIDTPVKHYSSGMRMRLAFSVAAHLESDIVLIDEVLAVGDYEFQRKCMNKMRDVTQSGKTVLFVSHNMSAMASLTKQSILLSRGQLIQKGTTSDVIRAYLQEEIDSCAMVEKESSLLQPSMTRIVLKTSHEGQVQGLRKPMQLECHVNVPKAHSGLAVTLFIMNEQGIQVCHNSTVEAGVYFGLQAGSFILKCDFPRVHLYPGRYYFDVVLNDRRGLINLQKESKICSFVVANLEDDHLDDVGATAGFFVEDAQWVQSV